MPLSPRQGLAQAARHRRRQRRKRRSSKPWNRCIATARQIKCWLEYAYPQRRLPDDDAGRDDAALMLAYLAHGPHSTTKMEAFVDGWCPWMEPGERQALLQETARSRPPRFTADALAQRLGVTYSVRQFLGLTLIGSIDVDKQERERLRRARDRERGRQRKELMRRAKGAKPRQQYLAGSLSQAKPWDVEGVSRRTWYRRRAMAEAQHQGVAQVRPSASLAKS
jgi:hypothetical protein